MTSPMLRVREFKRFIWSTDYPLGAGATSFVYRGIDKESGDPCAVKENREKFSTAVRDSFMNEVETLRQINRSKCEFVVNMLDSGYHLNTRVLILEYCEGGSLQHVIEKPENAFGVSEKEFLLIFDHLTHGVEFLYQNNIVHRDIKPGNILKSVRSGGEIIYKLTDFGGSIRLRNSNEEFQSLVGTEEYLHPTVFESALILRQKGRSFTSSIDMWSLGATFYHVITGSVPFKPYNGRKDRDTMYHILRNLQPGMIAGFQTQPGGSIEWVRVLPPTCQLSVMLRRKMEAIIASIFHQVEPWTYDKFFKEAFQDIIGKKIIHIVHPQSFSFVEALVPAGATRENLEQSLASFTDLSPQHFHLFDSRHSLRELSSDSDILAQLFNSAESPFVLLTNRSSHSSLAAIKLPPMRILDDYGGFSGERDYYRIKQATSDVLLIHRLVTSLHAVFEQSTTMLNNVLRIQKDVVNHFYFKQKTLLQTLADTKKIVAVESPLYQQITDLENNPAINTLDQLWHGIASTGHFTTLYLTSPAARLKEIIQELNQNGLLCSEILAFFRECCKPSGPDRQPQQLDEFKQTRLQFGQRKVRDIVNKSTELYSKMTEIAKSCFIDIRRFAMDLAELSTKIDALEVSLKKMDAEKSRLLDGVGKSNTLKVEETKVEKAVGSSEIIAQESEHGSEKDRVLKRSSENFMAEWEKNVPVDLIAKFQELMANIEENNKTLEELDSSDEHGT